MLFGHVVGLGGHIFCAGNDISLATSGRLQLECEVDGKGIFKATTD